MDRLRAHPESWDQRQALAAGFSPMPGEPEPAAAPDRRRVARWVSRGLAVLLALVILAVGYLAVTAPLSKSLRPLSRPQVTLLAADGTPIARSGALVEAPVRAKALPRHVVRAFLSIEDRRFYSHWGIDPRGMARAAWVNLTTGKTQGGSTITQQLAKITFLTPDQSLIRKLREVVIAFWLEVWLTKDQVLERYLSNAYFGDNAYGLRAASLHYFHRQPEALSKAQAAMLAGLVKAPSRLAPTRNYRLAERRMRVVLHAMVDAGYLKAREAAMIAPPLSICVRRTSRLRLNSSVTFRGRLPKFMLVPPTHSRQ
jgi:penicillin-binding protein 1A